MGLLEIAVVGVVAFAVYHYGFAVTAAWVKAEIAKAVADIKKL